MAASYSKTPVLEPLFSSEYCEYLRAPILKNICVRLLLKMCLWNWEKLKFIRSFNCKLKNQYQYSTSISETSENVCFCFMTGLPWSLYSHTIFLLCGEKWVSSTKYLQSLFTKYLRLTLLFIWKIVHHGKSLVSVFKSFLLVLTKLLFWRGDWAIDYHCMEFRHFSDNSLFPKILSIYLCIVSFITVYL